MRFNSVGFTRRGVLRTFASVAATTLVPGVGFAQSIFSNFERNRILSETDREANSRIAIDAIAGSDPVISADTEFNLQRVAEYYRRLVAVGGWQPVPQGAHGVVLGMRRDEVRPLRSFLVNTGDLPEGSPLSDVVDAPLDVAIRGFQARHGLAISGQVDDATFLAMQVPAQTRLTQIELNLQRLRNLQGHLGGERYVLVNIPAATIEAVDGAQVASRHTAIVGRIDRQTPILQSRIHQINFNPYWHVPRSIIERDIIPLMQNDPNYLTDNRIRIMDGSGNEIPPTAIDWNTTQALSYNMRQDPGTQNSMGHVKINFHNPHAVYLHDTPQQALFTDVQRFHSSGCVRVDRVDEMVAWILRDSGYDIISVNTTFASGERRDASVTNPPRILTTYLTAWANRTGVVSFRDDVYEFDAAGRTDFPELA